MGGFGSWELAMRKPDLFAALAPVCGGAHCSQMERIRQIPVWIAHSDDDQVVPVARSRNSFAALKSLNAKVTYVEYQGVGHNSWTPTFTDPDGMLPWLFRQQK